MNAMTDSGVMKHRLTVDDYYRMAEVGVLAPDARVELIEGEIIDMAPIGSRHAGTVSWLHMQLFTAVGKAAIISSQSPSRLSNITEPQPDLLLLRPRDDHYRQSHPTARDILLLIEVSDSTLRYDRDTKMPLYASYGVRESWLVDLEHDELSCHRSPHNGGYLEVISTRAPAGTPIAALEGVTVDLSRLFAF
jgi:Uma2 family endonuclease